MTTTLANSMIALSKDLNDYWASTSTSAGAAGGTSIVDTALSAKPSDWITDYAYDRVTSGTYINEERKISSLSSSTLTTLAHGGQIASAVTYEVHRLFTASDKRLALIHACKDSWPYLFERIVDENLVTGNWLRNGGFEKWTVSTTPDHWTVVLSTAAVDTTNPFFGTSHLKLSGAAGYLYQSGSLNSLLYRLRGKTVTLGCRGACDTATSARISITYDSTTTYGSYFSANSTWDIAEDTYVTVTIPETAVTITTTIHKGTGTLYVDDIEVISDPCDRVYVGDLGLVQDFPYQISYQARGFETSEPWFKLHDWEIRDDYLYLGTAPMSSQRLRIEGMKYLDFTVSGATSTLWTATVPVDEPQLQILVAYAAIYLYQQMTMPNFTTGTRGDYRTAMEFWEKELDRRVGKFKMPRPGAVVRWT